MNSDTAVERKAYFEGLYAKDEDPWRYDSCDYEIAKRADTLSFLREHYRNACEVGCSIGVLTQTLAPRCARIVGIDVSETAAALARQRLADQPNVEIRVLHLPHQDIDERFDLLVLSEMLYFLDPTELRALADLASRRVEPGGDVLIVSYDGETQTRLTGRQASDVFVAAACAGAFELVHAQQRQEYHVRLLRRRHGDR